MVADLKPTRITEPALLRLSSLAALDACEMDALDQAAQRRSLLPGHREILPGGEARRGRHILLRGWAYRVRLLADGRRQILGFLLPGDLFGGDRQGSHVALNSVMSMTPVETCPAPAANQGDDGLAEAYAISGTIDEYYTYRQIVRLGRLSALERIADWLLEMHERLSANGLAENSTFPLPLTQEIMADTLGLTSVHVNRMLQTLRRNGLAKLTGGTATILDKERLSSLADVRPAHYTRSELI
jgi:CRP-like cAMP-binding protein